VLDPDGQNFTIKIFVRAPYDEYVNANTRFWQASGIDLSISANGLSLQTQSLLSILIGGVAFESPPNTAIALPPADANTAFTLYDTRAEAYEPPVENPQTYELSFNESVRGLTPGAPVEFRGIKIGEVSDVRAQIDLINFKFRIPVTITLDPRRLGVQVIKAVPGMDLEIMRRRLIDSLVAHGVRAQLRTGNMLTGQAYVAFDFFPTAPPTTIDWSQTPVRLPTVPGQLEATVASVTEIIQKVNQIPLQQIGERLSEVLGNLNKTLVTAQGALATANTTLISARSTFNSANGVVQPNSVQAQELDNTLQELTRAARSVRVLADYLERHPDALLRGKPGEAK